MIADIRAQCSILHFGLKPDFRCSDHEGRLCGFPTIRCIRSSLALPAKTFGSKGGTTSKLDAGKLRLVQIGLTALPRFIRMFQDRHFPGLLTNQLPAERYPVLPQSNPHASTFQYLRDAIRYHLSQNTNCRHFLLPFSLAFGCSQQTS